MNQNTTPFPAAFPPSGVTPGQPVTPTDVFSDSFRITLHMYGSAIMFAAHDFDTQQDVPQVNVRLTMTNLKMITFALYRSLLSFQQDNDVVVTIDDGLLESSNITREQWAAFWNELIDPPAEEPYNGLAEVDQPAPVGQDINATDTG